MVLVKEVTVQLQRCNLGLLLVLQSDEAAADRLLMGVVPHVLDG